VPRLPSVPLLAGKDAALCAFFFGLITIFSADAFAHQYPFLSVPGGPKNVESLFQDSRGRLWLGGKEPACFDGSRFFFLRDYGFPPVQAYSFGEDTSGGIWIAAETGVYQFANGRAEEIAKGAASSIAAVTPDLAVAVMVPLGQSILGDASLFRIRRSGNAWETDMVARLNSPGPITLDSGGMLLYREPSEGWNEIRLEDVRRWQLGSQLPILRHPRADQARYGRMKVMRDHAGCVWLGSEPGTAFNCGELFRGALPAGVPTRANLHEAPDGRMVVWGDSVLAIGRPGNFQVATQANGLPGLVDAIAGRDGTIWLGTKEGLYRFASPFQLDYWTIREGISEAPQSVTRSGGQIYAGLERGRIVVLTEGRQRWTSVANFDARGFVTSLLPLPDGGLLATFLAGGAVQLASNGQVLARNDERPSEGYRLARTPDGEIWLGDSGLGRLTRRGNVLVYERHRLEAGPSASVLAIKYEEHTRKLWSCYNGGLIVRDERGDWKEFTTRDGLLVNGCWSLAPLPNGDVWYAYRGVNALALIKPVADGNITIRQYRANDGIPEPGSLSMDADRRGWVWRAGEGGVYVASAAEAEAGEWLQLDQSDGFPANGMNTGSTFVDNDGSVWWGADNDLAHYLPPSDLVAPQFSPRIFVSALSWDGQAPRLAEAIAAMPHGSKVVAHIGSLQFDRRNALRLRYRILPNQSSWRESGTLDLPLGSLSSGTHILQVQGRVFTGPWSETVSRSLTILRPVWLTWPALIGFGLIGFALAGFGLGWRKRLARRAKSRLPDLAKLRLEALAPEVHDVLGKVLDGRYEVGEILARGGFATVLTGRDLQQGERCAVKIFRPELKDDEWLAHRFRQEVSALEQIHHPNVARIYGHGKTPGGAPYLVMEFVDGKTLRDAMQEDRIAISRIASLLRQAGNALDQIHARGIYHRDLKPENIMLRSASSPEQELVIIDFSIAIVQDPDKSVQGISRAAGSIIYMAPENAVGFADASTDIHSLAKILIELLTGRRLVELLPQASIDLPSRVREVLAGRPFGLSEASIELICAATEFHPSGRPKNASEFTDQIATDLEGANLPSGPSANSAPSPSDSGSAATSGP
jgi:serine/threonine-protein kinase